MFENIRGAKSLLVLKMQGFQQHMLAESQAAFLLKYHAKVILDALLNNSVVANELYPGSAYSNSVIAKGFNALMERHLKIAVPLPNEFSFEPGQLTSFMRVTNGENSSENMFVVNTNPFIKNPQERHGRIIGEIHSITRDNIREELGAAGVYLLNANE